MQASAEVSNAGAEGRATGLSGWSLGGWIARLVGCLSLEQARGLGALVGWLAGSVLRIRRAHVVRAMQRAGVAQSQAIRLADAMYGSLGASLLETVWLAGRPDASVRELTSLDEWSRARIDEARRGGRGVVFATAHTGNWELAAAAYAEARPLTVVVKPLRVGWIERVCRAARISRGIRLAAPEGAMSCARSALRRGEAVAIVIDQVPERARHAVTADFLCGEVDVDRSAAALAASMRAPLLVAVSRRDEEDTQHLEVICVLEPPERGRAAWITEATRAATRALDRWVHAHPSEWLWMHRRWRRAAR